MHEWIPDGCSERYRRTAWDAIKWEWYNDKVLWIMIASSVGLIGWMLYDCFIIGTDIWR